MKVLVASTVYAPSIGGIETVCALIIESLLGDGNSVTVLTRTPSDTPDDTRISIKRRPSWAATLRAFSNTDLAILMGPAITLGWPLFLLRRRAVVVHQVCPPAHRSRFYKLLVRILSGRARHVACSEFVAARVGNNCSAVGNPYDNSLFTIDEKSKRREDLAFLGRLVPEKGVDTLFDALALVARTGLRPRLTVIGSGPLQKRLELKAVALGITEQVSFVGSVVGPPLARLLNQFNILIVPSAWEEPFGIVALEAIACGCVVIGSSGGGLPEAIGPCGVTFRNGDAKQLAKRIQSILQDPLGPENYRSHAPKHLACFTPSAVVGRYLEKAGAPSTSRKGGLSACVLNPPSQRAPSDAGAFDNTHTQP